MRSRRAVAIAARTVVADQRDDHALGRGARTQRKAPLRVLLAQHARGKLDARDLHRRPRSALDAFPPPSALHFVLRRTPPPHGGEETGELSPDLDTEFDRQG